MSSLFEAATRASANPSVAAPRKRRVAFLSVMPSPYAADLFAALSRSNDIDPRVFYQELAPPDTHWQPPALPDYAELLPGRSIGVLGGRIHLNRGAIARLRASEAELYVVGGYAGLANQAVMHWLHATRRPWVFWGEVPGMRPLRGARKWLRWIAQRPAVRWPSAIAAIGSRAAAEYRRLAPASCHIANIPYHCDLAPFLAIDRQAEWNSSPPERVRFLYCGQLIERKGVDLLVRAFCRVAAEHPHVTLTLVGEGPLREALSQSVPEAFRPRVTFTGFRQIDEVPRAFEAADAFVLPSRHDGWGVVVNQALAAGLPLLCSDAVGAAHDLVVPESNGLMFAADDEAALEAALRRLAAEPGLCKTWGASARTRAADWTPQRGAQRWSELCRQVLG